MKKTRTVTIHIEGIKEALSLRDALKITAYWSKTNKRRHSLIESKLAETITSKQMVELKYLQKLAGYKRTLVWI